MCEICEMVKRGPEYVPEEWATKYHDRVKEAEAQGLTLAEYMKGKPRWVSLHGHSEYSLLDGAARIEDIIRKVKYMGQDAVAITDHGNLYGVVKAARAAKKAGVKYIVGAELYITPRGHSRHDKSYGRSDRPSRHQVVLAMNKTGYKNLCKLSSLGWSEGFYRVPRVDRELMERYNEGLIVTSSCIGGTIPQAIAEGDFSTAKAELEWFLEVFGDRFFIEIQDHGFDEEKRAYEEMRKLAQEYKIPLVATSDAHYLDSTDEVTHDALICVGTGQWVDQPERKFKFEGTGYHYQSEEEMRLRFPGEEEALFNAGRIADMCEDDVVELGGDINIPPFDVPDDPEFEQWEGWKEWI